MILFSVSHSVRKAFHIIPVDTTPVVNSLDWFRFWRIDARKIPGRGEVMLFTNYETLYTFVADCREFRTGPELALHFLHRFKEIFSGHFGYAEEIRERMVVHRAVDRSVVAVMNSYFLDIEYDGPRESLRELEARINDTPIVSRNIFPADRLKEKLAEKRN